MSITAYVKPTNACNVGCSHCYLPLDVRMNKARMSPEVLVQTADLLATMQRRARHRGVHVLWHGGEPMTLPADWFWDAAKVLDERLPGHTQSMQTSLIPYRDEFLPLIQQRFDNQVGSSVDFSQRMIKGSVEAYHRLWLQKADRLRQEGVLIVAGIVPTTRDLGNEERIVQWFEDRHFTMYNIDRYNQYGESLPDYPSNRDHAHFLIGMFDALIRRMELKGEAALVGAVRAGISGVLYGIPGDRWGGSCQSDFVVVEPDGSLNNCPDKARFDPSYGSVQEGFESFEKSPQRRHWIRVQNLLHKKSHCQTCENNSWCKSGCPITRNGWEDGEEECSGYKTFLDHVREYEAAGGRDVLEAYVRQPILWPQAERALSYGAAQ